MDDLSQLSQDYELVARAIQYVQENFQRQPSLKEISDHVGYSESHFHRLFTRWVGISPKRFLQFLTKEYALNLLRRSANVLQVAYQSGLSGSGRLHDLLVTCEAVTPGEIKALGAGLTISFGFHPTPFGECLLAHTARGVCSLSFLKPDGHEEAFQRLQALFPKAQLLESPASSRLFIEQIFFPGKRALPLPVMLHGTNFQIKVWEALLRIPPGTVVTYEDVAEYIGMPRASRAVGRAVGSNHLPVIIPCHRVIRKDGGLGGYAFGTDRKLALLGYEFSQQEREPLGMA